MTTKLTVTTALIFPLAFSALAGSPVANEIARDRGHVIVISDPSIGNSNVGPGSRVAGVLFPTRVALQNTAAMDRLSPEEEHHEIDAD